MSPLQFQARGLLAFLLFAAVLSAVAIGADTKAAVSHYEAELLVRVGVKPEVDSILAFVATSAPADQNLAPIPQLIEQLKSESFSTRKTAAARLAEFREHAIPQLTLARFGPDVEVSNAAKKLLMQLGAKRSPKFIAALKKSVAYLGRIDHPRAAESIFRLLPTAIDAELEFACWHALDGLAAREPATLVTAQAHVRSEFPLRRATAGYLLARRGGADDQVLAKKRLGDPVAEVRLRVAQGLLGAGSDSGIPTLIELLREPASVTVGWQAEEMLRCVAGENAPSAFLLAGGKAERESCLETWRYWWECTRVSPTIPKWTMSNRPTLVVATRAQGFFIVGRDGAGRVSVPVRHGRFQELLSSDRFLMAFGSDSWDNSMNENMIPELRVCNFAGKTLWKESLPSYGSDIYPAMLARTRVDGAMLWASEYRYAWIRSGDPNAGVRHLFPNEDGAPLMASRHILYRDGFVIARRRIQGGAKVEWTELETDGEPERRVIPLPNSIRDHVPQVLNSGDLLFESAMDVHVTRKFIVVDRKGMGTRHEAGDLVYMGQFQDGSLLMWKQGQQARLLETDYNFSVIATLSKQSGGSDRPILEMIRLGFSR